MNTLCRVLCSIILLGYLSIFSGCAGKDGSSGNAASNAEPDMNRVLDDTEVLKVGISASYPPVAFKESGHFQGIEVDFARRLAKELKCRVRAINIPWEGLIPSLLSGRIDVIMSGMSITPDRAVRIAFTRPYLVTGLVAAMRNSDRNKYGSREDIIDSNVSVGVIRGTVGERFVRRNLFRTSRIVLFEQSDDAAAALSENKITLFIHDAPAVMWAVSKHESDICGLWEPLNEERLAWGVRKDDVELHNRLNGILDKWFDDGTVSEIINRWLPYRLEK